MKILGWLIYLMNSCADNDILSCGDKDIDNYVTIPGYFIIHLHPT